MSRTIFLSLETLIAFGAAMYGILRDRDEMRLVWFGNAVLALFFFGGYMVLEFTSVSRAVWSETMQNGTYLTFPIVWTIPPIASALQWQHTRRGVVSALYVPPTLSDDQDDGAR